MITDCYKSDFLTQNQFIVTLFAEVGGGQNFSTTTRK